MKDTDEKTKSQSNEKSTESQTNEGGDQATKQGAKGDDGTKGKRMRPKRMSAAERKEKKAEEAKERERQRIERERQKERERATKINPEDPSEIPFTPGKVDELMVRMAANMGPMRRDFLVVKMQPKCWKCRKYITTKQRYICKICWDSPENIDYALCLKCHEEEMKLSDLERHPKLMHDGCTPCPIAHDLVVDELQDPKVIAALAAERCPEPDSDIECDFFTTRTQFLSLCQGNHYQFDQLRRAKHSSMMVLYHLHNPAAPSFVHSCNVCAKEVTQVRFQCTVCPDFDMCMDCAKTNKGRCPKSHQLKRINMQHDAMTALTTEQRQSRARSISLHMQLLEHASGCMIKDCPSHNCSKMKNLLRHGATCKIRATGGCSICRRIWALLQIHARQCKDVSGKCPVPRCKDLKEHLRQVRLKAQQVEDRRRRAVYKQVCEESTGGEKAKGAKKATEKK
jgi:E1A/CREB-binding protein